MLKLSAELSVNTPEGLEKLFIMDLSLHLALFLEILPVFLDTPRFLHEKLDNYACWFVGHIVDVIILFWLSFKSNSN